MKNKLIVAIFLFIMATTTFIFGVFSLSAVNTVEPQGSISYVAYKARKYSNSTYTYYTSIQSAIESATDGDIIEVIRSHTISAPITVSKNITLMASDGLSVALTRGISFYGNMLQVLSGGTLNLGTSAAGYTGLLTFDGEERQLGQYGQPLVASASSLTIKAGIVLQNNYTYANALAVNIQSGSFTMSGGTITNNKVVTDTDCAAVYFASGTTGSISGGTINVPTTLNSEKAILINSGATVTISGGVVNGQESQNAVKLIGTTETKATVNVNGTANIQGIDATYGQVNVYNGSISNEINLYASNCSLINGTHTANIITPTTTSATGCVLNISGGTVGYVYLNGNSGLNMSGNPTITRVVLGASNKYIYAHNTMTNINVIPIEPNAYTTGRRVVIYVDGMTPQLEKFSLYNGEENDAELFVYGREILIGTTKDLTITLTDETYVYNGTLRQPTVAVAVDGVNLTLTTHYTLSGDLTATNVGTYTISVTGAGIYSNKSGSKQWTITPNSTSLDVTLTESSFTYSGSLITPYISQVKAGSTVLTTSDYEVVTASSTTSATNIGDYVITVRGIGNYSGTGTAEWHITPLALTSVTFASVTYNGSAQTPVATVLPSGATYSLSPSNYTQTDAGTYTVTVVGTGNYSGTVSNSWTINTKALTGTWGATDSWTYDGSAHGPAFNGWTGVVAGDTANISYLLTDATATNVGDYTAYAQITGTKANNYHIADGGSKIYHITAQFLTAVTFTTTTYDATTQTAIVSSITPSGALSTNSYEFVGTYQYKNAGTYTITIRGTGNYQGNVQASWTINKANTIVVSWSNTTLTYTGSLQGPTASITSGVISGDSVGVSVSGQQSAVGSYTATATLNGTDKDNYTILSGETTTYTIGTKALTLSWGSLSFVYNGTAQKPTVSILTGVIGIEVVTVSVSDTYLRTDVGGPYTAVATLGGTNAGNYHITSGDETKSFYITKKQITINWTPSGTATYVYNGTAQGPTPALSGIETIDIGEQKVALSITNGTATNVGEYEASVSLTGSRAFNYEISVGASKEYSITPADLEEIIFKSVTYTYNATTRTLAPTGVPTGVTVSYLTTVTEYNPDGSNLTKPDSTSNSFKEAGVYVITASFDGGTNYEDTTKIATLTINRASISIKADDKTSVYGENIVSPLTWSVLSGEIFSGDNTSFNGIFNISTLATSSSDVGTYTISISTDGHKNYSITTVVGTYTITKATLTGITFDNDTVTYDSQAHSIEPLASSLPSGVSVSSYSTSAKEYKAQISDAYETATTVSTNSFTNAGQYVITAYISGGTNYENTTKIATLQINRKAVTYYAVDKSSVYGETPVALTFALHASSTVYAGDVSGVEATLSLTCSVTNSSNVGEYDIELSTSGHKNYNITVQDGTYEVTKATITGLTFSDKTETYDNSQKTITITGTLPNGTSVDYTTTSAQEYNASGTLVSVTAGTNAYTESGVYAVSASITGSNYETLTLTATLTISRREVTYTADDQNTAYGATVATLTYQLTSGTVITGQESSVTGTLSIVTNPIVTTSSSVGNYDIELSTSGHKNYDITTVNGIYTVGKQNITGVTFEDKTEIYNGSAFSIVATTLPSGTNIRVTDPYITQAKENNADGSAPASATTVNSNSFTNAGTYVITVCISGGDNYNDANFTATLTINRATPTLEFNQSSVTLTAGNSATNVATPTPTTGGAVSYASLDTGVATVNSSGVATAKLNYTSLSTTITATLAGTKNYTSQTASYTLTIEEAVAQVDTTSTYYTSISAAVAAAPADSTIIVLKSHPISSSTITINKNLQILSNTDVTVTSANTITSVLFSVTAGYVTFGGGSGVLTFNGVNATGGVGAINILSTGSVCMAGKITFTHFYGGVFTVNTSGILNIEGGSFTYNQNNNGGVINCLDGDIHIENADFSHNTATQSGGVIYYSSSAELDIDIVDSSFTYNTATQSGGVIYNSATYFSLVITGGTYNYNSTTNGPGGVIYTSLIAGYIDVSITGIEANYNSANGSGAVFYIQNTTTVDTIFVISSCNFEENIASFSEGTIYGGVIYTNYINFNIEYSAFLSNTTSSDTYGIALYVANTSSFNITGSTFDGGSSTEESADVCGGALYLVNVTLNIIGETSYFTNNVATADGGAIYLLNSTIEVIGYGEFAENHADGNGGAIYANNSTVTLLGTHNYNTSDSNGGALYLVNVTLNIDDASFMHNVATADGGAIYMSNTTGTIGNVYIEGNEAFNGGALYITASSSITLKNTSEYYQNTAENDGSVIYLNNSSLTMTEIWGMFQNNIAGRYATLYSTGSQLNFTQTTVDDYIEFSENTSFDASDIYANALQNSVINMGGNVNIAGYVYLNSDNNFVNVTSEMLNTTAIKLGLNSSYYTIGRKIVDFGELDVQLSKFILTGNANYELIVIQNTLVVGSAQPLQFNLTGTLNYNGSSQQPTYTITVGGIELVKDATNGYEIINEGEQLSIVSATNAGTYTIYIKGKGNYVNKTGSFQWTILPQSVEITLNAGAGSSGATTGSWVWASNAYTQTLSATGTNTLGTLPSPTKAGYTFAGWETAGAVAIDANTLVPATDTTYNAKWELISYSITYDYAGGTVGTTNPVGAWFNTVYSIYSPEKDGYTFTGWTLTGTNPDYNTAKYGVSSETVTTAISSSSVKAIGSSATALTYILNLASVNGSVTLTATWTPTVYTITYNLNGGSWTSGYTAPASYNIESSAVTLPIMGNITKANYVFAGWYDNVGLTGSAVTTISTGSTGNKTYWAKWNTAVAKNDRTGIYYTTIASAVADATDGDTILVIASHTITNAVTIDKNLTIKSPTDVDVTVTRDASFTTSMFIINSGYTLTFGGGTGEITIDGNNVNGGVFLNNGTLTINSGTFSNNHGTNGGVICAEINSLTTISGGNFTNNSASGDGGVISGDFAGLIAISGGTFTNNSATRGGVIDNYRTLTANNGGLRISGGTFKGNTASECGGVIYFDSYVDFITGGTFGGIGEGEGNSAPQGGVIFNGGSILTISNASFIKNLAYYNVENSGRGGVIYNQSTIVINNGTFTENLSNDHAGVIYNTGTVTINSGTFNANRSEYLGGVIYNNATLSINNGTFKSNVAAHSGGVVYNTVDGTTNITGGQFGGQNEGEGNQASGAVGGAICNDKTGILSVIAGSGKTIRFYNNVSNDFPENDIYNPHDSFEIGGNVENNSGFIAGTIFVTATLTNTNPIVLTCLPSETPVVTFTTTFQENKFVNSNSEYPLYRIDNSLYCVEAMSYFTVEYYYQNPDGTYPTEVSDESDVNIYYLSTGSTINESTVALYDDPDGEDQAIQRIHYLKYYYSHMTPSTATVTPNNATVVKMYYNREIYTLTLESEPIGAFSYVTLDSDGIDDIDGNVYYIRYGSNIQLFYVLANEDAYSFNRFSADTYVSGGINDIPATNIMNMPKLNVIVTALATPNTYTLTFNANGGSTGEVSRQRHYDEPFGKLPNAEKIGSTFLGWFNQALTIPYESGSQMPDHDLTIYAKWQVNNYTLTFNPNGGSVSPSSMQVTYGQILSNLPTPTKSGYDFDGWFGLGVGWDGSTAATSFAGGAGTQASPYQINNASQLKYLANLVNTAGTTETYSTKYYILTAHIDLGACQNWIPIGTSYQTKFQGSFDGNGYQIHNLNITTPSTGYVGLFGYTLNAILNNVILSNVDIDINYSAATLHVGSIVGYAQTPTIINSQVIGANSSINVSTSRTANVGGLIGDVPSASTNYAYYNLINNASITVVQTGTGVNTFVGGIAGAYTFVESVVNNGLINVTSASTAGNATCVGGIVGREGFTAFALNTNAITVYASTAHVGGIIGYSTTAKEDIMYAVNEGDIYLETNNESTAFTIGGVVGMAQSVSFYNVFNFGSVELKTNHAPSADSRIGGVVGYANLTVNKDSANVFNNATITVTIGGVSGIRNVNIGGVFGEFGNANGQDSIIENVSNTASINISTAGAKVNVGGVFGKLFCSAYNVYNIGNITATSLQTYIGGIVGLSNNAVAKIYFAFNTGNLTATSTDAAAYTDVGGISGYKGTILYSYNIGSVTAIGAVGKTFADAIVNVGTSGSCTSCYYNNTVTVVEGGVENEDWENANGTYNGSLNIAYFKTPSTFTQTYFTWDASIWNFVSGYYPSVKSSVYVYPDVVEETIATFTSYTSDIEYENGTVFNHAGNLTLTANWTPTNYTISYVTNGDSSWASGYTAPANYNIESNEIFLPTLENITLANAVFAGWYDNSGLTGIAITSISTGSTGNKVYYAKWNTAVAKNDTTGIFYQTLEAAVSAVTADNNVILIIANATVSSQMTINYNMTIKSNTAYTITRNAGFTTSMFVINSGKTLTFGGGTATLSVDGVGIEVTTSGAVFSNAGTLNISTNSRFIRNYTVATTSDMGGGVVYNTGTLNITGGTFGGSALNTNYSLKNGGVIYNNGGSVAISGSPSFTYNYATSGQGSAGVLYSTGAAATTTISGSPTFSYNSATNGGVVITTGGASITISGGTFTYNTATTNAGAMQLNGNSTISGGTFSNNTASAGVGGAIRNPGSGTLTITSGTFNNNSAYTNGGAIYNENVLNISGNPSFSGNTQSNGALTADILSTSGKKVYVPSALSSTGIKLTTASFTIASVLVTYSTELTPSLSNFTLVGNSSYKLVNPTSTYDLVIGSTSDMSFTLTGTPYTYDGTAKTPTLTVTVGGVTLVKDAVNGYVVLNETGKVSETSATDTGTYTIYIRGTGAYSDKETSQTWTINTRAITITATDKSKTYGSANPSFTYSITTGSLASGHTATVPMTTTAGTTSNVGTYAITIGTVSISNGTDVTANYSITKVNGTLTINPKVVSNLTVTLSSTSTVYNGSQQSVSVSSVQDGVTALTLTDYTVVSGTTGTTAGTYTVTVSGAGNYAGSSGTAEWTITQKEVIITWSGGTTFTYTGSAQGPDYTQSGLVATDVSSSYVSHSANAKQTNANASPYTRTVTLDGTRASSYYLTNASQNYTISKADTNIVMSPASLEVFVGQTNNSSLTATLKRGTTAISGASLTNSGVTSTYATITSTSTNASGVSQFTIVGNQAITATTVTVSYAGDSNHNSTSATFSLTITQLVLTINASTNGTTAVSTNATPGTHSVSIKNINVSYNGTIYIFATASTGYLFDSWTKNSGTGTVTNTGAANTTVTNITTNVTMSVSFTAKAYTITLNQNGATTNGSTSATATYDSSTLTTITNPLKTGYTFAGWTITQDGTDTLITTSGTLTASVSGYTDSSSKWVRDNTATVYAKWTVKTYTITLNQNGATTNGSTSATATYDSSTLTAITNPLKTGYTFAGWTITQNGTDTLITTGGALTASVSGYTDSSNRWVRDNIATLYANWTTNPYSITVTITRLETTATPIQVWLDTTGSQDYTTATYKTSGTGSTLTISNVPFGTSGTIRAEYTNAGTYNFIQTGSHTTTSTGTGTDVNLATGFTVSTSNSASGKIAQLYQVTYARSTSPVVGTGTLPSTQTKIHGTNITLGTNVSTATGYTQNGWNTTSTGSGTAYANGVSYTSNSALALFEAWTANPYSITVTITRLETTASTIQVWLDTTGSQTYSTATYKTSGTGGTLTISNVPFGTNGTIRAEYTNAGTYNFIQTGSHTTTSTGTGTDVNLATSFTVSTSNSASGKIAQLYLITYARSTSPVVGIGTLPSTQTKIHGTNITLGTNVSTATGYTQNGWNTNSTGSGTAYTNGASYTSNAALALFEAWTLTNYTITYDENGGSTVSDQTYKITDATITLPTTITRANYVFAGWKVTSVTASTVYKSSGSFATVNDIITQVYTGSFGNITVQAQWTVAVAKNENTGIYYADLQTAIDTAGLEHKLIILADITISQTINISSDDLTIKANSAVSLTRAAGFTGGDMIYFDGDFLRLGGGTGLLTISGNNISTAYAGLYHNGIGLYILNNVKFTGHKNTANAGAIFAWGDIYMSGGEISGNSGGVAGGIASPSSIVIMTGGLITNNTTTTYGAGVHALTFLMTGGSITANTVSGQSNYGGGVAAQSAYLLGGTISTNSAYLGGGVFATGELLLATSKTLNGTAYSGTGVTISGNTAVAGAGIYNTSGSILTISAGTVGSNGNVSTQMGGGIYVENHAIFAYTVSISGGTISGNVASHGAGIYIAGANGTASITGGNFINNSATANGGALYNDGAISISGSPTFSGNTQSNGTVSSDIYLATGYKVAVPSALTVSNPIRITSQTTAAGTTVVTFTTLPASPLNLFVMSSNHALYVSGNDLKISAPVAQNEGTSIKYTSISDAVTYSTTGDIILVIASHTITNAVTINKTLTIKAPTGVNVTVTRGALFTSTMFTISSGYTLTFGGGTGIVTINGNNVYSSDGGIFDNFGTLLISSGVFIYNIADAGAVIANSGTLTINGGTYDSNTADEFYGGVIINSGTVTIGGGIFSDNSASIAGGVIWNNATGQITISGGTFSSNTSDSGAVIYNINILSISGGTYTGNSSNFDGGVILNDSGSVTISSGTFKGNSASANYAGGVIYNAGISTDTGTVTISGGTFGGTGTGEANTATYGGVISNGQYGEVNISNASFIGNSVTDYGGVIYNAGTSVTITSGTFNSNTSDYNGGVIFNTSTLTINDGTFKSNIAVTSGGVLYSEGTSVVGATVTITGGVFGATGEGNTGTEVYGAIYVNEYTTLSLVAGSGKSIRFAGNSADEIGDDIYSDSTSNINIGGNVENTSEFVLKTTLVVTSTLTNTNAIKIIASTDGTAAVSFTTYQDGKFVSADASYTLYQQGNNLYMGPVNAVARVNTTFYDSLQSAISAVSTNDGVINLIGNVTISETITLHRSYNHALSAGNYYIMPEGADRTITRASGFTGDMFSLTYVSTFPSGYSQSEVTFGDSTNTYTLTLNGGSVASTAGYVIAKYGTGTITLEGKIDISNNLYNTLLSDRGTLNINSTGTIAGGSYYTVYMSNSGSVNVSNATLTSSFTTVWNAGTGTFTLNGGSITKTGMLNQAISNYSTGTIEIVDGVISSSASYAILNNSTGSVEISGGEISATGIAIFNNISGTIDISGGEISGTGTVTFGVIHNITGTVTISDGDILGSVTITKSNSGSVTISGTANISATQYGIYNNYASGGVYVAGSATIYGGQYGIYNNSTGTIYLEGSPTITGGRFGIYLNAVSNTTAYIKITGNLTLSSHLYIQHSSANYYIYKQVEYTLFIVEKLSSSYTVTDTQNATIRVYDSYINDDLPSNYSDYGWLYGTGWVSPFYTDGWSWAKWDVNTFKIHALSCFSSNTYITVWDEKRKRLMRKKAKDIKYTDKILVWNFDKGCYDFANPLTIQREDKAMTYYEIYFSDGSVLEIVNDHAIFNVDKNMFTPMVSDDINYGSPVGTRVMNDKGEVVTIVAKKKINKSISYTNIFTKFHLNLYANGILTSTPFNNMYPIKDMKFIPDDRQCHMKSLLDGINDEWRQGMRLDIIPDNILIAGLKNFPDCKTFADYVNKKIAMQKPKE